MPSEKSWRPLSEREAHASHPEPSLDLLLQVLEIRQKQMEHKFVQAWYKETDEKYAHDNKCFSFPKNRSIPQFRNYLVHSL